MGNEARVLEPVQRSDIRILVVDDEASIRRTLEGIFHDEGFETLVAQDGKEALALIRSERPSLVLLDIWMPGMDGIETLEKIKASHPDLPVIMISGHATIATAIGATRLGAADFIEKPLDLNATLDSVKRALGKDAPQRSFEEKPSAEEADPLSIGRTWETLQLNPVAFQDVVMKGRRFPQRTLAQTALLYGQGLHSGKKSGLILEPLPPNSGIHFVGVSERTAVPAHVDFVESTGFATTVRLGRTQAGTIEHVMSALHAYGISNLLIKCNGEVPVMDGSAREFCSLFEEIGVEEQQGDWYEIAINKPLRVERGKESITIEPSEDFTIDYTLDYPHPIGTQRRVFTLGDDVAEYRKEIASARTFGFVKDINMLQKQGLALGGRFDNFVLIGPDGPINDSMRYPDEQVRHKILDAIGDLYLLGRRLRGRVTAVMTGHSENIGLLKLVRDELKKAARGI